MRCLVAMVALLSISPGASALPIVALDMDPSTSAIESVRTVTPGSTFTVAVVYDAAGDPNLVNGFEFDLAYESAQLTAVAVRAGDFLLAPTRKVEALLGLSEVGVAFVSDGSGGAGGSGVLAWIDFVAPMMGSTSLDLNDVVAAAPFGVQIPLTVVSRGSVSVPEPANALLLAIGLLTLAATRNPHA